MKYPPTSGLPEPDVGAAAEATRLHKQRAMPWCPEKRRGDPAWAAAENAQRQDKEAQEARRILSMPDIPAAPPEYAEKQQRFLKVIESMRAELDALPAEERSLRYDQLKTAFLGE